MWLCALATVDLPAGRRENPPWAAELVEALAGRLAGLVVADPVVERVAVVGDLELSVLALRRAEQGRTHAGAGDRLAVREERRPEGGAGPVADTGRALVGREVVDRDALAVDKDATECGLANGELRPAASGAARKRYARGSRRDQGAEGDGREQFGPVRHDSPSNC